LLSDDWSYLEDKQVKAGDTAGLAWDSHYWPHVDERDWCGEYEEAASAIVTESMWRSGRLRPTPMHPGDLGIEEARDGDS